MKEQKIKKNYMKNANPDYHYFLYIFIFISKVASNAGDQVTVLSSCSCQFQHSDGLDRLNPFSNSSNLTSRVGWDGSKYPSLIFMVHKFSF